MNRTPIPPKVLLEGLDPEQQRKIIRLALQVVYELGKGNDYAAYEMIDFENIEQDYVLYTALHSLLDSSQRSRIKAQSELAHR